jgi:hypothetical protein
MTFFMAVCWPLVRSGSIITSPETLDHTPGKIFNQYPQSKGMQENAIFVPTP